jgi:hypothetical protein
MVSLIIYGSLMNSNCLSKYDFERKKIVKLYDYERHCNQKSVSRKGRKGVFNLEENKGKWINCILLESLDEDDWRDIVFRERGYSMIDIEDKKIEDYKRGEQIEYNNLKVFIGSREEENISSSLDYIEYCLQGAKQKSKDFYKDFCETSYIYENGDRIRLDNYIGN